MDYHVRGTRIDANPPPHPRFFEALRVWLKIGVLSFGGPSGQIALMHRELVDRHQWVSDARFLHALNYCMLLPGPEAQQLAIYFGWLLHRAWGGIIAGLLFVLPGAVCIWGISVVYAIFGAVPWISAIFEGLKPAVIAIILSAMLRIARRALRGPLPWAIAIAAFVAIFALGVPFPVIIAVAAGVGAFFGKGFEAAPEKDDRDPRQFVIGDAFHDTETRPHLRDTLLSIVAWTVVWLLPLGLCAGFFGSAHLLTQESAFFSTAAVITFGGAYAVLPYVAQQAVETHGWLSATQMMDGLALAETTPGPLVLVLQFVGFLGGWNHPAPLSPLAMATLAAFVSSWATFVPGFLFIFAGAPWIETSRRNSRLAAALSGVTAAVVGVILNLAVWFAWHVIHPGPDRYEALPVLLAAAFFALLQWAKWDVLWIVALGAASGLAAHFIG